MAACEDVEKVRRIVDIAQTMIDLTIDQLDSLRTRCAVTEEITQQEIRKLEGKLIKLYSKQLAAKAKLPNPLPPDMIIQYPLLQQWLQVVGLTENSIQMICSKVNTLEALKEKSELELNSMLNENCIYYKEECRRLCKALDNLWRYTDILIKGGMEKDSNLYWDSWDSYHLRKKSCEENPKPNLSPTARCSIPSESSIPYHNNNGVLSPASSSLVSSSSLSLSPCISLPKQEYEIKARKTPPPFRKHLIKVQNNPIRFEMFLIDKLKLNHESKVVMKSRFELDNDDDDTSSSFRSDSSIEKKSDSPVRRDLPIEQSLDCGIIDSEKEESLLSNSSSIKSPVKSPIKSFIESPIESPIESSVEPSIEPPIESSIESPIESPTESPIESPIELLMKSPVKLPVKSPVKSFFKPPPICTTNVESDDNNLEKTGRSFQVPKSPFTSDAICGMSHTIAHRFAKSFNVMTVCDYCLKPMFMNILKCRECKYRCHRECRIKVPPSCGLPRQFIAAFKRSIQMCAENSQLSQLSPVLMKTNDESPPNNHVQLPSSNRKDRRQSYTQTSTNTSSQGESNLNTFSKNRSTPSSPALPSTTISHSTHSFLKQFHFPDVLTKKETLSEKLHEKRYKSESAISKRRKSDVDGKHKNRILSTLRGKTSDLMVPKRTDSQESPSSDSEIEIENTCRWPRQDSILMKEWDIAYNELKIRNMIGKGRFSTVYRGYWHGNIAIKFLNMNYHSKDEKTLETFKLEVATYRVSRHDNIILFLGVCMKPPQLALVTSLTRGLSLHYCLHIRKDRYTLGEINSIAQQICQGMIYLHSRNIIHKDLRSKNVFVENGKVMISDFGLFNITKLCHGNRKGEPLNIPPGWLCYLAPEIIRRLKPLNRGQDKLPYTFDSDIYAFGTIWYELLCGEWPFKGQPIETIIWQIGKGMKQSLSNLQASRDVKDILMYCWSYYANRRLDFIQLTTLLKKLPRKKLARSSSNPTNSARSAESMF